MAISIPSTKDSIGSAPVIYSFSPLGLLGKKEQSSQILLFISL